MDKYQQEIFQFLTIRENFEARLRINEHFSTVREELLNVFWNKVEVKIVEMLNLLYGYFLIINPHNKERGDAKLIIYKKEWKLNETHPFVGIAWEHLFANTYYGVWSNIKSTNIDSVKLRLALDPVRGSLGYKAEANWWPLWEFGKCNFSQDNQIAFILPDRVDATVDEYSSRVVDLIPSVEKIIDEVVSSNK